MSQERYTIDADGTLIVADGVTIIKEKEFRDFDKITKVVLPRTVQQIGSGAFWGCVKMKSINIPVGVRYVESFTFHGCESLTEIVIPEGVVRIETNAFGGCKKLKKVSLPSTLQELKEQSFDHCSSLKEIVVPAHTEIECRWCLGYYWTPFMHCDALEKVIIREVEPRVSKTQAKRIILLKEGIHHPSGPIYGAIVPGESGEDMSKYARSVVRDLYYESFRNSALFLDWEEDNFKPANLFSDSLNEDNPHYTVLDIPEGISPKTKQIENYCCLSDISLHRNLTGEGNIVWTPYVESVITVAEPVESEPVSEPEGQTDSYVGKPIIVASTKKELQDIIAEGKYDVEEPYVVQLPESCTEVSADAFWRDKTIGKVILPDTVTSIGDNAFALCDNLAEVSIPDSVVRIGKGCFLGCSCLSKISIPESICEIGPCAFSNCSSLEVISLPEGITEIGKNAFKGCSALKEIHIYNPLLLNQAGVGHDAKVILE